MYMCFLLFVGLLILMSKCFFSYFNLKISLINVSTPNFCLNLDLVHYIKSVRIWSYSDPHFPAFTLNTERYSVNFWKFDIFSGVLSSPHQGTEAGCYIRAFFRYLFRLKQSPSLATSTMKMQICCKKESIFFHQLITFTINKFKIF